ncbi:MAG: 3-dehydroquinate synthase [Planctomycetes bacterium]|nr:3-dehydroquinate synthase [Planctomycetota bacterium]
MPSVAIKLPHHAYEVLIEPGALDRMGAIVRGLAPHDRCALFADANVHNIYGGRATTSLRSAGYTVTSGTMIPGESHKTLDTVAKMYDVMLDDRLERRSPVIALGGGITGDTVGFVAATYLRGVPFVQVPTSLLAMVDASVGGKVGVNVPQGKNLIGAFHQPVVVIIDPLVLATLPPRELRCGLAECVKHGVIRDASLIDFIDENLPKIQAIKPAAMVELIERNVAIKAAVVMEDEKETGVRAHLNFGHTFAHAIEATTGYGTIEHGEAVSLGMVAATTLAVEIGLCPPAVLERLAALLVNIGLPVRAKLADSSTLLASMRLDKKVKDARIRLILPTRLGEVIMRNDIADDAIVRAWEAIRE